jgi:riboflavin biosynthesis pyrimidine reductase
MPVIANLVLGSDGSSRVGADSRALSTLADRARFLAQRHSRDCIIIGGQTARQFGYSRSPCPVIVLSRTQTDLLPENPQAFSWHIPPQEAIAKASRNFGPTIGMEGGPTLLFTFLKLGLIDLLELSVTPITGGEDRVDFQNLLSFFKEIKEERVDETIFFTCSEPTKK